MKLPIHVSYLMSGIVFAVIAKPIVANIASEFNTSEKLMQKVEPNNLGYDSNNLNITVIYDNYPFRELK
jgi:hypothetical protein